MRLQKAIAQAGIASRRKAESLILDGKVKVNGVIVNVLGTIVNDEDEIEVNGQKIKKEHFVYFLFNKPIGVVTTVKDDRERKTVLDYFKDVNERIFPVGRLDINTSGLLLLTNDGELSSLMTHPSSHLNKTYRARLDRMLTFEEKKIMEQGIVLEDGLTAPCKVILHDENKVDITIHEGRNRQVRRMFEYFGIKVLSLTRISIGNIKLGSLKKGEHIDLPLDIVEQIKKECLYNKAHNTYKKVK
ncbi:MAG: pseudouridine synthase [Bacilli bacterium]